LISLDAGDLPFQDFVRPLVVDVLADVEISPFDRLVALEVMRRNKGFYDFPGTRIEYAEFGSGDAGATWSTVATRLPPVFSVVAR